VESLIGFGLGLHRNFQGVVIVLHEYWGIVNKCTLNRAARLLPRLLFVVELESYGKHDHFVNVYGDVPLLFQPLQIILVTRGIDFHCHFPNSEPKTIHARNSYFVGRFDDQRRGIGEAEPERSIR